jgi:hypothetical protein
MNAPAFDDVIVGGGSAGCVVVLPASFSPRIKKLTAFNRARASLRQCSVHFWTFPPSCTIA